MICSLKGLLELKLTIMHTQIKAQNSIKIISFLIQVLIPQQHEDGIIIILMDSYLDIY